MDNSSMALALEKIHGMDYATLVDAYDLSAPHAFPELVNFHLVRKKLAFGLTRNCEEIFSGERRVAVIGGPCICYCQADIRKVTAQDVIDVVNPVSLAAYLDLPVIVYIQVHEAVLQQREIDHFQSNEAEWEQVYVQLEKLTDHIASLFDLPSSRVNIISTSHPKVKSIMDDVLSIKKVERYLTPQFLNGLYSINGQSPRSGDNQVPPLLLDTYRRNLATYLPVTVGRLVNEEFPSILVVENCTQLKASCKANQLHQDLFPDTGSSIGQLVYISTPGLSGHEMYKSFPRHQIRMDIQDGYLRKRLSRAGEFIKEYYGDIWAEQVGGGEDTDGVRRFIEGFNLIRGGLD